MIEDILPPQAAAHEAFGDHVEVMAFPEEQEVVARAVGSRRREFATGRACARAALARLGAPAGPILPGPDGAPQWPSGFTGSITHCPGYRAAAVARVSDLLAIGLDAELNQPLPGGVQELISLKTERAELAGLAAGRPDVCWDRLLFCAKEAVYKAWSPLTGEWLGFDQAAITLQPDAGAFEVALLVPGPVVNGEPLRGFAGRWLARDGLLLTAVTVAA